MLKTFIRLATRSLFQKKINNYVLEKQKSRFSFIGKWNIEKLNFKDSVQPHWQKAFQMQSHQKMTLHFKKDLNFKINLNIIEASGTWRALNENKILLNDTKTKESFLFLVDAEQFPLIIFTALDGEFKDFVFLTRRIG